LAHHVAIPNQRVGFEIAALNDHELLRLNEKVTRQGSRQRRGPGDVYDTVIGPDVEPVNPSRDSGNDVGHISIRSVELGPWNKPWLALNAPMTLFQPVRVRMPPPRTVALVIHAN
jgi:hypothetical protein